jgi:UDP-N-acetylmuramate--alanine ligase
MSALARYFMHEGMRVAGYDLTETPLTRELEAEGANIHYTDDVNLIPDDFRDPASTLVVYTPAVPVDHSEFRWFRERGFEVEKRSEMLGHVAQGKFTMAVAGTHGKTTTTTLVAWLNSRLTGGSAFLGGISKNFNSNLVLSTAQDALASERRSGKARKIFETERTNAYVTEQKSQRNAASPPLSRQRLAVEADEFDRSFLRLTPDVAVITSVDPDHLDIYGTYEAVREAFTQFVDRIVPGGSVIVNSKVDIEIRNHNIARYTYSLDNPASDFHAVNLRPLPTGQYLYDIVTPGGTIADCTLGIPGRVNVENSIAAVALLWVAGDVDADKLRQALADFRGVRRRFDVWVNTPSGVFIDDYAHHPEELTAALGSMREMFPGRRLTAIFQPHLYTRTRDLHREFADALSLANEVILVPIYPARELPIEGVDSEMIGRHIAPTTPWRVVEKERLAAEIAAAPTDIVVTFGAGNIDLFCADIAEKIREKSEK